PSTSSGAEENILESEIENLVEILRDRKFEDTAIDEFINLGINKLPYTVKTYAAYYAWKEKCNVDETISEFEPEASEVLMHTEEREVQWRLSKFLEEIRPSLEDLSSLLHSYVDLGEGSGIEDKYMEIWNRLMSRARLAMRYAIHGDLSTDEYTELNDIDEKSADYEKEFIVKVRAELRAKV
ncbi:hypothetical protein PMAYCL1PPCAC_07978, partial [Pristionchus mayeri]